MPDKALDVTKPAMRRKLCDVGMQVEAVARANQIGQTVRVGGQSVSDSHCYALFLDFDGTLADIAPRPDAVVVEPGLVDALERLRARLGGALAIVSGRPIAVIDGFLAPAQFDVAGLHGVERRAGGTITGGRAQDHPDLRGALQRLEATIGGLGGVILEDKGASVSVHWRLARPDAAEAAQAAIAALAQEAGQGYRLQLGKSVGEVVPADATKGIAIRTFGQEAPYAGRRVIFMGDDRTDEIAFESVNADGGVSVRVGEGETIGRHRLAAPADVRALITAWSDGAAIDVAALPPV